jgi:hypothetical protein
VRNYLPAFQTKITGHLKYFCWTLATLTADQFVTVCKFFFVSSVVIQNLQRSVRDFVLL